MLMLLTAFFLNFAHARTGAPITSVGWHAQNESIWDTRLGRWLTLDDFAKTAVPGDIFVFGEDHADLTNANSPETYIHHDNQTRLIRALQFNLHSRNSAVSVGMEFLDYTLQKFVDQYLAGTLDEPTFLKSVGWNMSRPFEFYRSQILSTRGTSGFTRALNVPDAISNQVAQKGKNSLTFSQQVLLPPLWEKGNSDYYQRFTTEMANHPGFTPTDIENYFWAQSLWDDTMAWQAIDVHDDNPNNVTVIIVGEFHMKFSGGLPYEIRKQNPTPVKTILQIEASDWSPNTLSYLASPDPQYGNKADYIWVHFGSVKN